MRARPTALTAGLVAFACACSTHEHSPTGPRARSAPALPLRPAAASLAAAGPPPPAPAAVTAPAAVEAAADAVEPGIPLLPGLTVDGRPDDWGDRGYARLARPANPFAPGTPADLGTSFRIAWCTNGLALLFESGDPIIRVAPKSMWEGDSVEAWISLRDPQNKIKIIAAPNPDAAGRAPVLELHDFSGRSRKVDVRGATVRGKVSGYTIELLVAWPSFGVEPRAGDRVTLDLRFNSSDAPGQTRRVRWAAPDTPPLRLVRRAPLVPSAVCGVRYGDAGELLVRALAPADWAGRTVRVSAGGREIEGPLADDDGWAVFGGALPDFGSGGSADAVAFSIGDGDARSSLRTERAEFFAGPFRSGEPWPTYQHDAARSGVCAEKLAYPLATTWRYATPHPPAPAWPEPGKENHRLDFDYAFQPVIADGLAFFASSADDTLRAADLDSGALRWRFTAGGPIRFAPHVAAGRACFGSDDGWIYCLDARSGAVQWKVRGAPAERRLLGNGRMVSRWPCRSGVLIESNTVYASAGMWPADGVYVYALDLATGREIWCNDSSATRYVNQPHGGASAFTGVTPQGYMASAGDLLLVPSGRTTPGAYDRRDGSLRWYQPYLYIPGYPAESWNARACGGSLLTVADDIYFNPLHAVGAPDLRCMVGEAGPQPGDGLAAFSVKTGLREKSMQNVHRVLVSGNRLFAVGGGEVMAADLAAWRRTGDLGAARKWSAPFGRVYSIAMAGDALLLGGAEGIAAYRAGDGLPLGEMKTGEQVRGMAVSSKRLVASTNKGRLICFGVGRPALPPPDLSEPHAWGTAAPGRHTATAQALLRQAGVSGGYALVTGCREPRLAAALAMQSDLRVVCMLPAGSDADRARRELLDGHLYGERLWVDTAGASADLPYPSYFADLVVVSGETPPCAASELYRTLRPCGGRMVFVDMPPADARRIAAASGAPVEEIAGDGAGVTIVRGRLPGAGEWRNHFADAGRTGVGGESRLRLPLEVLWFGGAGPDRMNPRHWGASGPLALNGRIFVLGSDHAICMDAYNGREVWAAPLPGAGRAEVDMYAPNFTADADSVYAAVSNVCHRLSQDTGRTLAVYEAPALPALKDAAGGEIAWGYLSVAGDLVIGGCTVETNGEVYAAALFAVDRTDGRVKWTHAPARQAIPNSAIAHDGTTLYALSRPRPPKRDRPLRPQPGPRDCELVALKLATGEPLWRRPLRLDRWSVRCADGVVLVAGHGAFDAATGRELWSRKNWKDDPIVCGDLLAGGSYNQATPGCDLRTGKPRMVPDPVTGEPHPWKFFRAYGCGDVIGCKNLLFFRSGVVGVFDVAAEALTTFGGIRPNCSVSMAPANGLLCVPEGSSACSCSYNFQTSLALVPGGSDADLWYVFGGDAATGRVQRLRINFGAPGDRRDADGNGWLCYPREVIAHARPVWIDAELESPGWYHRRSLASALRGEPRPWLYASGFAGAGRLCIPVVPRTEIVVPECAQAPAIDGRLDDGAWAAAPSVRLWQKADQAAPKATVLLCQDARAIYVGYRREAAVKDGAAVPFVAAATNEAAACKLGDDAIEIFAADAGGGRAVRVGLAAGGGMFDGLRASETQRVDFAWNGKWIGKTAVSAQAFVAEMALPLATLKEAGLDTGTLSINVLARNTSGVGVRDIHLVPPGDGGWPLCTKFLKVARAAAEVTQKPYTIRLHFLEPDSARAGERVFDVALQGRPVLERFDVASAGGPVVKEFRGVPVRAALEVLLAPARGSRLPPVLCGMELISE